MRLQRASVRLIGEEAAQRRGGGGTPDEAATSLLDAATPSQGGLKLFGSGGGLLS